MTERIVKTCEKDFTIKKRFKSMEFQQNKLNRPKSGAGKPNAITTAILHEKDKTSK